MSDADIHERSLLILGARSFAPVVADLVDDIAGFRVTHFVENLERDRCRETIEGLPILWVEDLRELAGTHCAVCALGSTHRNKFIEQVSAYGMEFVTLVHPSAVVSAKATVEDGCIVSPGVIMAAYAEVGGHILLNRGALVGHNAIIGTYATIGPGANVAGFSRVGEGTYIGMGAKVLDHVSVGAHSIVGAGAVVNRDVPDNVTVAGVPARIIKENTSGL